MLFFCDITLECFVELVAHGKFSVNNIIKIFFKIASYSAIRDMATSSPRRGILNCMFIRAATASMPRR